MCKPLARASQNSDKQRQKDSLKPGKPRHYILGFFCRDSSSGGVLIIISEELRGRFASCRSEEIEKGRALLVTLGGGGFV